MVGLSLNFLWHRGVTSKAVMAAKAKAIKGVRQLCSAVGQGVIVLTLLEQWERIRTVRLFWVGDGKEE